MLSLAGKACQGQMLLGFIISDEEKSFKLLTKGVNLINLVSSALKM
jgi:hypothetical protein